MTLDKLQAGKTYDLKGAMVHLAKPLYVPPGSVTVCNGKIDFQGNGAAVGAPSMAIFYTDAHSGQIHLENIHPQMNDHCAVVHTDTGGRVSARNVCYSAGSIWWGNGAESIELVNFWSPGTPDKYHFCNFGKPVKILRVDNSACTHELKQGIHEAGTREMMIDDSRIVGLKIKGSGIKQAAQSRPGGFANKDAAGKLHRDRFTRHVYVACVIDSIDAGNFKDKTDVNFPFGTLDLLRLEDCTIGHFALTTDGADPLSFDEMGIRKVEIVNCTIGGKLVNRTITH